MTIALLDRRIAGDDDGGAVVVRTIAGNVDDAAQAPMRVLVEQRHREIDRARDRGARRPADRRLHDFVGDGIRRFRPLDHPPRDDDLLVGGCRPFEIGHRDLAVRAALQRLQELLGDDGLRVTLALDRQFVHVHRIGDVDGQEPVRHRRTAWIPCRPIAGPAHRRIGCFGLGAAIPATSPPASTPATSTAPIETYQRIAALPSTGGDGDTQIAPRKGLIIICPSHLG